MNFPKPNTAGESSCLSLTTAGSSMNAALGGVSATGRGTPASDVTQRGGGPCAFVATQPEGNVGGITSSKFSRGNANGCQQSGHWSEPSVRGKRSTRPEP